MTPPLGFPNMTNSTGCPRSNFPERNALDPFSYVVSSIFEELVGRLRLLVVFAYQK